MTTPRDLLIIAMDTEARRPVEQGELSLALAGAELIDLLSAEAIRLDDDHIVPAYRPTIEDHLLDQAAAWLVRQEPYESVSDWLWRRGDGLATAYMTALESEGQLTRQQGRWTLRAGHTTLVDSPARRRAADRWTAQEPILTALGTAAGLTDTELSDPELSDPELSDPELTGPELTDTEPADVQTEDAPSVPDDAMATVLAAVNDAVRELEAERQRRAIEKAAFDNIWRGGVG